MVEAVAGAGGRWQLAGEVVGAGAVVGAVAVAGGSIDEWKLFPEGSLRERI